MDKSASIPSSAEDLIGIPMTGTVVYAAKTPGRCAAFPAAPIITSMPLSLALFANNDAASGVLCADITLTMGSTPYSFNSLIAPFKIGKSESDPIITATFGFAMTAFPSTCSRRLRVVPQFRSRSACDRTSARLWVPGRPCACAGGRPRGRPPSPCPSPPLRCRPTPLPR